MDAKIICPGIIRSTSQIWGGFEKYGTPKTVSKGSLISFDGEDAYDFLYIRKGKISINYYESSGKYRCQLICCDKTLVNEANILTRFYINKSQYYCTEPCDVVIYKEDVAKNILFKRFPDLIANIAFSQAVKGMHISALLNALSLRSRPQQICWYILQLFLAHGEKTPFSLDVPQCVIASLLGINDRTFKRHIARLKEEGILSRFTKLQIAIGDLGRLKALSQPSGV